MANLVRWDPVRDFERSFEALMRPYWQGGEGRSGASAFAPAVDVAEDEKQYHLSFDLPGFEKDSVKVMVENKVLTVSGERKSEHVEDGKSNRRFHRSERLFGSFTRSFQLPDDADASKIDAEFKEGVLSVRLPKREEAQPKVIDVKVH